MQALEQIFNFEGHPLLPVLWNNRPVWVAKDVGHALGYSAEGARLTKLITGKWSEEFEEGREYLRLEGDELDRFRAFVSPQEGPANGFVSPQRGPANVSSMAREVIVLTLEGLIAVGQLTSKPVGTQFRRWSRRDVLYTLLVEGEVSLDGLRHKGLSFDQRIRAQRKTLAAVNAMQRQVKAGALSQDEANRIAREKLYAVGLAPTPELPTPPEAPKDAIAQFIEACLTPADAFLPNAELHAAHAEWCKQNGHKPASPVLLGQRLSKAGFEKGRKSSKYSAVRGWKAFLRPISGHPD